MSDAELKLSQFSLDRAAIGILRISLDGRLLSANEFICQKLGYSREELLEMTIFDINPTFTPEDWARHIKLFIGLSTPRVFETVHRRKSGVTFPVEVTVTYLQFEGQEFFVACSRDLTDQKLAEAERARLQAQLSSTQRLDSVGRLAGGVAHDFNNMLTVILGRTDELLEELPPESPWREALEEILQAAQRSAELTRQLLTFARRGSSTPRVLDLDTSIAATVKMLRRLIGEEIELTFDAGSGGWPVKLDPAQLDQVLVNLVVNARDAIAATGRISLGTSQLRVAERSGALPPGEYVRLLVRDDGAGMDAETRERIFEPFFSTKAVGRGTGLGLATVFGIVSQSAGHITVESEPGRGTTFSLFFPRAADAHEPGERETFVARGGNERVLLVEDDPMVLRLTHALLETLGYAVTSVACPTDALAALRAVTFDALVTDLLLPELSGRELARTARTLQPSLGVLLMSGHLEEAGANLPVGTQHIRKPFTRLQLDQRLRAALEARPIDTLAR
ncbi:MAG: ATP-binding protein [Myxococcota bacterium]